jgi:predicted Holliday junction resolvase-like endonuclease
MKEIFIFILFFDVLCFGIKSRKRDTCSQFLQKKKNVENETKTSLYQRSSTQNRETKKKHQRKKKEYIRKKTKNEK